jgi:hypothetical protein
MSDEVGPVEQRYAAFWKRLGPSAATLQESREWRSQIDAELKALGFSGFDLGKILDIIEADAKLNGQDASHYGRLDKFDDILHEIRTWVELQRFKTRNAQTVDDGETLVTTSEHFVGRLRSQISLSQQRLMEKRGVGVYER